MVEHATRHVMVCEAENTNEVLLACPTCGRKVVVGKGDAKLVVLDRGDVYAQHSGSTGGLSLTVAVPS